MSFKRKVNGPAQPKQPKKAGNIVVGEPIFREGDGAKFAKVVNALQGAVLSKPARIVCAIEDINSALCRTITVYIDKVQVAKVWAIHARFGNTSDFVAKANFEASDNGQIAREALTKIVGLDEA